MKKILYVNTWMHPKNHHSIKSYKNITLHEINNVALIDTIDLSMFDCVYSPSSPINVEKYPNTKFLFGPHFSVFPEKNQITEENKQVKKVCNGCYWKEECLTYALHYKVVGIWGGKTTKERDRIRKQLNIIAKPITNERYVA